MDEDTEGKGMGQVIQIDEDRIRAHLGEMVRGTVEDALNAIAKAMAFLASPAASFIRGANLSIDGNLTRGIQL